MKHQSTEDNNGVSVSGESNSSDDAHLPDLSCVSQGNDHSDAERHVYLHAVLPPPIHEHRYGERLSLAGLCSKLTHTTYVLKMTYHLCVKNDIPPWFCFSSFVSTDEMLERMAVQKAARKARKAAEKLLSASSAVVAPSDLAPSVAAAANLGSAAQATSPVRAADQRPTSSTAPEHAAANLGSAAQATSPGRAADQRPTSSTAPEQSRVQTPTIVAETPTIVAERVRVSFSSTFIGEHVQSPAQPRSALRQPQLLRLNQDAMLVLSQIHGGDRECLPPLDIQECAELLIHLRDAASTIFACPLPESIALSALDISRYLPASAGVPTIMGAFHCLTDGVRSEAVSASNPATELLSAIDRVHVPSQSPLRPKLHVFFQQFPRFQQSSHEATFHAAVTSGLLQDCAAPHTPQPANAVVTSSPLRDMFSKRSSPSSPSENQAHPPMGRPISRRCKLLRPLPAPMTVPTPVPTATVGIQTMEERADSELSSGLLSPKHTTASLKQFTTSQTQTCLSASSAETQTCLSASSDTMNLQEVSTELQRCMRAELQHWLGFLSHLH